MPDEHRQSRGVYGEATRRDRRRAHADHIARSPSSRSPRTTPRCDSPTSPARGALLQWEPARGRARRHQPHHRVLSRTARHAAHGGAAMTRSSSRGARRRAWRRRSSLRPRAVRRSSRATSRRAGRCSRPRSPSTTQKRLRQRRDRIRAPDARPLGARHAAAARALVPRARARRQAASTCSRRRATRASRNRFPTTRSRRWRCCSPATSYAKLWRSPDLDPTYGDLAQIQYRQLAAIYPDSPCASRRTARRRTSTRRKAQKDFGIGMHYVRRKAFESSLIYFKDVVKNYPNDQGRARRADGDGRGLPAAGAAATCRRPRRRA